MTITEISDSLRREFAAELRAVRSQLGGRINQGRKEVRELAGQVGEYHLEGVRGLAHVGDELATLRGLLEPLAAAHARRARRREFARRAVTSVPGVLTAVAGAAAAVIALF